MSDTTDTETETETGTNTDTTDEPSKAELHERVEQLESTVGKLMPSRRDALKLGAAGLAGAAGLSATSQSVDASTGSAGQIGDSSNRPDIFADEIDANQLTGVSTGADRQGCRVFLSSNQSISNGNRAKIQFDSKVYDSGNNFSTASHAWTCPQDGIYMANLQIEYTGGGSSDARLAIIATATDSTPNNAGAFSRKQSSGSFGFISVSTINKYNSGDTIVGYAQNGNNSDSLGAGSDNEATFMEVAFLGGL